MRVLVFHGYLLRGTGSNVYNANLAQALVGLGHDVHLLCQEREAAELDWVHSIGRWEEGELRVEELRVPDEEGRLTVYLPDIGRLLPVYVYDEYTGFEVKAFADLDEAELNRYLDANVAAVRDVVESAGQPDVALANHLVMGPAILARSGLRFAAKVHGSALEYTVKPNPRFIPFAKEGAAAASGILVGSRHTAESLWEALPDLDLPAKTRLGPPGVDTSEFQHRDPSAAIAAVERLADAIEAQPSGQELGRDGEAAAAALREFAAAEGPRVVFVGKLIVSKGVDLLLAAWPLVHAANPGARLLLVGFGAYEDGLRRLLAGLQSGEAAEPLEVARRGRALEDGEESPLSILAAFLNDPPQGYWESAQAAAGSVSWAGRLEHDEVAQLLPAADALVMPSTFPEAFGMVAIEGAACGALPVSAAHSGMLEASSRIAEALDPDMARLLSFPIEEGAVEQLGERLLAWVAIDPARRREVGRQLAARVDELWSWTRVAEGVIAASEGCLDELPAP